MADFNRGETPRISIETRTAALVLATPATSMTITITDSEGTVLVSAAAMSLDATGKHHYDYAIASDAPLGTWKVRFIATDGARVSIEDSEFTVIE